MKHTYFFITVLLSLLIVETFFIFDHMAKVHYVEQKSVPDTIIVPETIEKLLYDTVTIRDTIETSGWIILDTLDSITVKWGGYLLPKGYSHKISLDTALIETLNVNNLTPADFDSALEALE